MNAEAQYGGSSITTALERLREAGQRMIANEIGLAKLETQERLSRNVRMGIYIGAGAAFGLIAWCTFVAAICVALATVMPMAGAIAVAGGLNLVIGAALIGVGLAQSNGERKLPGAGRQAIGQRSAGGYARSELTLEEERP